MIELKNVTKKYANITVIKNMSFKIEKGEVIGVLGQNGAGKTTVIKLITGLLQPTDGEVFINNKKLTTKMKKIIGYMPENTPLYEDLTVKEFIHYIAELKCIKKQQRNIEIEKIIKKLNLQDVKDKLIKNISKGYKQRTSLAAALVGNPEILILDEPTAGLDPQQVIEIRNMIKSLRKKHTIIISSHILSEITQICEKLLIINKGTLLTVDTPKNIENQINKNSIMITVEDPQNSIEKIKDIIPEIIKIKLNKKINEKNKQYEILIKEDIDIRKKLFEILPKQNITILELKKSEITLEEAFIKLINEQGGQ